MMDLVHTLGYNYVIGYVFPEASHFIWYTTTNPRQAQFLGLDIIGIRSF